jgi:predicted hotdog family 3-hydroxylacyl-ACP dehydratase
MEQQRCLLVTIQPAAQLVEAIGIEIVGQTLGITNSALQRIVDERVLHGFLLAGRHDRTCVLNLQEGVWMRSVAA